MSPLVGRKFPQQFRYGILSQNSIHATAPLAATFLQIWGSRRAQVSTEQLSLSILLPQQAHRVRDALFTFREGGEFFLRPGLLHLVAFARGKEEV